MGLLTYLYTSFRKSVNEIIFLPYAQNDYDGYTARVKAVLEPWGIKVSGAHTHTDPLNLLASTKAIYVGGGNTFLLLKRLYDLKILDVIRNRVENGNLLYIGASAGSNVATKSIHTTNDMPITYPPTFDAIGLVPFNINPHYVETVSDIHRGETRDQRIYEYLEMNYATPVLGLREGSILKVDGTVLTIKGVAGAVLFRKLVYLLHT